MHKNINIVSPIGRLALNVRFIGFILMILPTAVTAFGRFSFFQTRSFVLPSTRSHVRWMKKVALSSSVSSSAAADVVDDASKSIYDVIVVGGGHAGCEAAAAAARMGSRTLWITQRLDSIGELSCNPSIGGIGKGHLVREIDALGGVMAEVADRAGIHYRTLNSRKGPAVRGPRAQMDRDLYKIAMQDTMLNYSPNLELMEGSVQDLLLDELSSSKISTEKLYTPSTGLLGRTGDESSADSAAQYVARDAAAIHQQRHARVRGVIVELGNSTEEATSTTTINKPKSIQEVSGKCVIITTGTFLRGVLMLGRERYAGGRHLRDSEDVEPPSTQLAETLMRLQLPMSRLKTGTPARIDGNTIDWDDCLIQPSERPAQPFSHLLQFRNEQPSCLANDQVIDCYQTATNKKTHQLVLEYEHTLPVYDGLDGKGNGPRYCPSIYKKVQRFPDRQGHNCFLEPEGLKTNVVYPNGMSGPYPPEIQQKILRTMRGLGAVEIIRPGYDVEYDFVNPIALTHALETKIVGGLFLAGQINGSTGYEEAAAQGIVAGTNAAITAATSSNSVPINPFVIGRDEGYIGVLIDDLVTRGTMEPYRMFTSRAEYRITLRADNADLRLTRKAVEYGLVHDQERISALDSREIMIEDRLEKLRKFDLKVVDWMARGNSELMGGSQIAKKMGTRKTATEILSMPHVTLREVEDVMIQVQKEFEAAAMFLPAGDERVRVEVMEPSPPCIYDTVEAAVKYSSYVDRQHRDMESWRKAQGLRIPRDMTFDRVTLPTLNLEELEKLNAVRPTTFAQASQISGITPQALVSLYQTVMRRTKNREAAQSDIRKLADRQKKQAGAQ
jgi:tRNA uridine 5-carboxymethylaminomethyl modification enzyme